MVFAFCYYVSLLSGIYAALHFMISSRLAKGSLCQRVDKVLLGKKISGTGAATDDTRVLRVREKEAGGESLTAVSDKQVLN